MQLTNVFSSPFAKERGLNIGIEIDDRLPDGKFARKDAQNIKKCSVLILGASHNRSGRKALKPMRMMRFIKNENREKEYAMRMSIRFIIGWMILLMVTANFPDSTLCHAASLYAQADVFGTKTLHNPEVLSTPEKDIPLAKVEKTEKKGFSKWVWIGLGVLAVGGAALAFGGGGDDGGGNDGGTGDVSITW